LIDGHRGVVLRQVGALFRAGSFAGMSDGQLLEHFLSRGGEAGELAFSVLVERHGPMVLRVCRGVLGDRHDAEDAFQATFLALVRGAGSIRRRDSVACWLHGAALRVSACARSSGARRRKHEGQFAARRADSGRDRDVDDLARVVHEEVARLPARYGQAVALCDLEGLTLDEAAGHLGCPVGTVKSRVARGRERLRTRLARRGIVPATAVLGLTLARGASAAVRPALVDATSRAAAQLAAGRGVVGLLAATVETLVQSESRRILMRRLWAMTATLATAGVLMAGATLLGQQEGGDFVRLASALGGGGQTTVAAEPAGSTFVKVYSVADLLVGGGGRKADVDMSPLVELITSSVTPGAWKVLDSHGGVLDNQEGGRSITPFARDLTLIIRQTADAHEQVAERLDQLRKVLSIREANSADRAGPNAPVPVVPPPPGGAMRGMMRMMGAGGTGSSGSSTVVSAPAGSDVRPAAAPGDNKPKAEAPRTVVYTYRHPTLTPADVAPAQKPAGAAAYDVNVAMPIPPGMKPAVHVEAAREAETERRLRSLEEKLDRVLKALDVPKGDRTGDALPK
jgi:RNA polymerase sigma factor (sigma-70 family)